MPRMRFTLRRLIAATAVLALLIWLTPIIGSLIRLDFIDDAYAQWGAGEMVVKYLRDHDNRWPRGWEDLRPYFDAGGGRIGGWSFARFRRRIGIDWNADVADLEAQAKANPRATFRVIWATDVLASEMQFHEPNEIVHRYLRDGAY